MDGLTVYADINIDRRPFYTDEYIDSAWDVIKTDLLLLVLNKEIESARCVGKLWPHVRGHHFAKAAIEALFWDLEAQSKGLPAVELLGGGRKRLETGTSHSIFPAIEKLLMEVEEAVELGIPRVKLKIQPGWDIEPSPR